MGRAARASLEPSTDLPGRTSRGSPAPKPQPGPSPRGCSRPRWQSRSGRGAGKGTFRAGNAASHLAPLPAAPQGRLTAARELFWKASPTAGQRSRALPWAPRDEGSRKPGMLGALPVVPSPCSKRAGPHSLMVTLGLSWSKQGLPHILECPHHGGQPGQTGERSAALGAKGKCTERPGLEEEARSPGPAQPALSCRDANFPGVSCKDWTFAHPPRPHGCLWADSGAGWSMHHAPRSGQGPEFMLQPHLGPAPVANYGRCVHR